MWALGASKIAGVLDALRRHPDITVLGSPDEATAVLAADGTSRVSPVPGVAAFIGFVGLGVAAVGIQTIVHERRPVLLLIGQTDAGEREGAFQDTRASGSNDRAVLDALGCPNWSIHDPADLSKVWPEVTACLATGAPAALLLDESVQVADWSAPRLPRPNEMGPFKGSELADDVKARHEAVACCPTESQRGSWLTRADILNALARSVPGSHVFVDAGQARLVAEVLMLGGMPLRLHQCPNSASLGWALRASLGAAVETGDRVYVVGGDGGFQMAQAALVTAVRQRLAVTVILAVNGLLGVDSARGAYPPVDLRVPGADDWLRLGEAIGADTVLARTSHDLELSVVNNDSDTRLIVVPVVAFEDMDSAAALRMREQEMR